MDHFARQRGTKEAEEGCIPVASTDFAPGESACAHDDKRFPASGRAFREGLWADLGVDPSRLSRYFSFMIESSGVGLSARVALVAMGDLDCDDVPSTVRVYLRPNPREGDSCRLQRDGLETIDSWE